MTDKRKRYMADVYSKFWVRRVQEYGFSDYHRAMIELVNHFQSQVAGNRMLECAVGTGYPFALEFARRQWEIQGIDISPLLVAKCQENAREANVRIPNTVGDVENLPYANESFHLTYCLQSTWYFTHLRAAISEMVRVTTSKGYIIFDIMNILNPKILSEHARMVYAVMRSKATHILRGTASDQGVLHQTPTSPIGVWASLRRHNMEYSVVGLTPDGQQIRGASKYVAPRLVYICWKRGDGSKEYRRKRENTTD